MLVNLSSNISGLGIATATALGGLAVDAIEKLGGAMLDFGKSALTLAGDYEQNLNIFRSVSGATDEQMQQLRETAKALGNDMSLPGTSAAGAAGAMVELAKAGLTVDDSLSAAKG